MGEEPDEDIRDEIVGLCFLFLPLKTIGVFFLSLLHNVQTVSVSTPGQNY